MKFNLSTMIKSLVSVKQAVVSCFSILLVFAVSVSLNMFNSYAQPYVKGDVNGDAVIGIQDALEILKYLVDLPSAIDDGSVGDGSIGDGSGVNPLAWEAALIAARNLKDGEVPKPEIADVLEILKYLVFLDSELARACEDCGNVLCICDVQDLLCADCLEIPCRCVVEAVSVIACKHCTKIDCECIIAVHKDVCQCGVNDCDCDIETV